MLLVKNIKIIAQFLLIFSVLIESMPNWSYEFISIDVENETPDVMTVELRKNRVSRGVYAISGAYDIKQDLTDDFHMTAQSYFSATGSNDFIITPFHVPDQNLTEAMNTHYKNVMMESLIKCATNVPTFEDKFVAPLTKRLITINNCHISNEKMPSFQRSGYHKIVVKYFNQVNITSTFIVKIEQDF